MPSNLTSIVPSDGHSKRFKLIVYDLDGTIMDTLSDLGQAVNLAFEDLRQPRVTLEQVRTAIGDGAVILVQRLLPPSSDDRLLETAVDRFKSHYLDVCAASSSLLPGVEAFASARHQEGDRLQAILTNKPQAPSDILVHRFGLEKWIGRTIGGDTPLGKKPNPTGLRHLMAWAGAEPEQTLMVGDGPADLEVALACGVPCVRLDTGYGDPSALDAFPHKFRFAAFQDFAKGWDRLESAV